MLIRFAKFIILFLGILLLLLFAVVGWIATPSGTQAVLALAVKLVPGELSIEKVEGSLLSDITLQGISYQHDKHQVALAHLQLNWSPLKLLQKQIYINQLTMQHGNLFLANETAVKQPTAPEPSGNNNWQLIKKLRHLIIRQATIDDLVMRGKIHATIHHFLIQNPVSQQANFTLDASFAALTGTLNLQTGKVLSWQTDIALQRLNIGDFVPSVSSNINLNINSQGEWGRSTQQWQAKLTHLQGRLQNYKVSGSANISARQDLFLIQDTKISIGDAVLSVSGQKQASWDVKWLLSVPQLSHLVPSLHGSLSLTGSIVGPTENALAKAHLSARNLGSDTITVAALNADAVAQLNENFQGSGKLSFNQLRALDREMTAGQVDFDMVKKGKKLTSNLGIVVAENHANFSIVLPAFSGFSDTSQAVKGSGQVFFPTIGKILGVIPKIKSPTGQLTADVALSGRLNKPNVNATFLLDKGGVLVPDIGLTLSAINLRGLYQTGKPLTFTASLQAGQGTANLSGEFNPEEANLPLELTLKGNNLLLVNLKNYRLLVNPDLQISYEKTALALRGRIEIPEANITPANFSNVVTLSNDVVFENEAEAEKAAIDNLSLNVDIVLGKNIYLAYEDLTTHLTGSVSIKQTPGSLPVASGELTTVGGQYKAYGRVLNIRSGRLIYTGNALTNPGLDIQAVKQINTIAFASDQSQFAAGTAPAVYNGSNGLIVGVMVRGTLNRPRANLFSDPAGMGQNDILSYLLFGYPQSEITGASSLALLNSLSSSLHLGGDGNSPGFTDSLQKIFGLSELTVGSTEYFNPETNEAGNTTSVSIGKQLGKNLSLHYSIGLFYPVSILNLRYQISKHFALQSETSTVENGADFFYEYEK